MKNQTLLKHLDSPVRILSLSVHDLLGYAIPIFIGAMVDSLILVPLVGLFVVYFAKKPLKRLPRFYLIRYLYWTLPTAQYNKLARVAFPPSSRRLWVK